MKIIIRLVIRNLTPKQKAKYQQKVIEQHFSPPSTKIKSNYILTIYGVYDIGQHVIPTNKLVPQESKGGMFFVLCNN